MTARRRPNFKFKGRPRGVDSGRPQVVLRTSFKGFSEYLNLDVAVLFCNFSFRTYSTDQIYLKAFQHSRCIENPVKLLRWSIFGKLDNDF